MAKLDDVGEAIGKVAERFDAIVSRRRKDADGEKSEDRDALLRKAREEGYKRHREAENDPDARLSYKSAGAKRKDGYLSSDPVPTDKTLRKTDSAAGNYAAQLKSAWADSEQFDRTIAKLRADRSITTEVMREVAKDCVGHELRGSMGREAALQEIVKWQFLDARRSRRGANIIGGSEQERQAEYERAMRK